MQAPRILNFYLANLETDPVLEFGFSGGLFYKNTIILTFNFHPPGPGTFGALGVHQIKKLHKTKSDKRLILVWVPFIKNLEIPKFWSSPQPAPPYCPVFSGRGLKIKILLPTFFLPHPPVFENPGRRQIWRKSPFLGSGPDPKGCGLAGFGWVKTTCPKITCEE